MYIQKWTKFNLVSFNDSLVTVNDSLLTANHVFNLSSVTC